MNPSAELLVVILIVGTAAVALGQRFYLFISQSGREETACGSGCGGCASKADGLKSSLKPLIQLDLNSKKPH